MSIHIIFTDGSNPFIRYNLSPEDFAREILKRSKTFALAFHGTTDNTIFHFEAESKGR